MTRPHWRVVFDDRARKDLRRIDPPTRKRILAAIMKLGQGAELTGDIARLKGSNEYRLRVGDWRVRFERDRRQLIVSVVRVLPRGRAYVCASSPERSESHTNPRLPAAPRRPAAADKSAWRRK